MVCSTRARSSAEPSARRTEAGSRPQLVRPLAPRAQARGRGILALQWWVLWSLLAGLFALNSPSPCSSCVAHRGVASSITSVTVLTWTMVGRSSPTASPPRSSARPATSTGTGRLYLFGLLRAMVSALLTALAHNVDMLLSRERSTVYRVPRRAPRRAP